MPAAQPLSLDALRRLIADNDYWNPHSAQHQELQRKVCEGFGRLYPANDDATRDVTSRDQLNDLDELVRQLKQHHNNVDNEYIGLSKKYAPIVPELDEDGNPSGDLILPPPEINDRMNFLDQERRKLEDLLEHLGFPTGTRYQMER